MHRENLPSDLGERMLSALVALLAEQEGVTVEYVIEGAHGDGAVRTTKEEG